MPNQYKDAEAYIHFGSATDHPMCTVKCKAVREYRVTNPQRRFPPSGAVLLATSYQINIGGEWGNHWRRVWHSQTYAYFVLFEGKWCKVNIGTGL